MMLLRFPHKCRDNKESSPYFELLNIHDLIISDSKFGYLLGHFVDYLNDLFNFLLFLRFICFFKRIFNTAL